MRRFSIVLVLIGLVGAVPALAAAPARWSIQHTPNQPGAKYNELEAVACSSETACTAVGDYYPVGTSYYGPVHALVERWNGSGWSIQRLPLPAGTTASTLKGVACPSKTACIAVGDYNKDTKDTASLALVERWNGTKWSIQHVPIPQGPTTGHSFVRNSSFLTDVACASASACTAVGAYHIRDAGTYPLVERWNGSGWTRQHTPDPKGRQLGSVACTSRRACTALAGGTVVEHWNAHRWSIGYTAKPRGAIAMGLSSIDCSSETACTAVGRYAKYQPPCYGKAQPLAPSRCAGPRWLTLVERWNGAKWSIQGTPSPKDSPDPRGSVLSDVACASKNACIIVGSYFNGAATVTLAERWNGATWSIQHAANPSAATTNPGGGKYSTLNGVACPSAHACRAVGSWQFTPNGTESTLAERWSGG